MDKCFELLESKKEKFELFKELLIEYNEKCNLTSIIDDKEVLRQYCAKRLL